MLLLFEIIKFLSEILLIIEIELHLIDFSDLEICWQNHILNNFSLLTSHQPSEKKYS